MPQRCITGKAVSRLAYRAIIGACEYHSSGIREDRGRKEGDAHKYSKYACCAAVAVSAIPFPRSWAGRSSSGMAYKAPYIFYTGYNTSISKTHYPIPLMDTYVTVKPTAALWKASQ